LRRRVLMADKDDVDRGFAEAGWEPDGAFSEHLSIGNWGDLCIIAHWSTWKTDQPTFEIYDVERHVSHWVHEIPTPQQAATLLREHGRPSEDE
jgi:hypothetical protein